MAQIINRDTLAGRLGQGLGSGLSTGIGQGLQALAQQKVQNMRVNALKNAGYSEAEASLISQYPDELQFKFMQSLPAASQEQQPISQPQRQSIEELLSDESPSPKKNSPLDSLDTRDVINAINSPGLNALEENKIKPIPPEAIEKAPSADSLKSQDLVKMLNSLNAGVLKGYGVSPEQTEQLKSFLQQKIAKQEQQSKPNQVPQIRPGIPVTAPGVTEQEQEIQGQTRSLREALIANSPRAIEERRHQEKLAQKERIEGYKETKAERKEIIDRGRAARQNLDDLNRMEELEKEGKLDTPGYVELLKRAGMDIPALMNPGSEEFQKIAANFMRGAKNYVGSRVTNFELEQFLKTIPSLSQSPEGRKRVVSNLKKLNRMDIEYTNALKEVMAQNKGVPPLDLLEKIDTKVEKRIDAIGKKFKEDLDRPVPEGQNRLVTALQTALGSALGGITGAAKGAGKAIGGVSELAGLL